MIKRLHVSLAALAVLFLLPATGSAAPVRFNWSSGGSPFLCRSDISGRAFVAGR